MLLQQEQLLFSCFMFAHLTSLLLDGIDGISDDELEPNDKEEEKGLEPGEGVEDKEDAGKETVEVNDVDDVECIEIQSDSDDSDVEHLISLDRCWDSLIIIYYAIMQSYNHAVSAIQYTRCFVDCLRDARCLVAGRRTGTGGASQEGGIRKIFLRTGNYSPPPS